MAIGDHDSVTLCLVDGPYVVRADRRWAIPEGSKRLVAHVALNGRRVDRGRAAANLWPDADRARAAGNLRSAMWRLRCAGVDIVAADHALLTLDPRVRVDVEEIADWAHRLVSSTHVPSDVRLRQLALAALDLLPGWYDEWVLTVRDHMRQTVLQAIEVLSKCLVEDGRFGEAVEAALTAVSVDPLRETAQQVLIEAHLAEGNRCEALRSYRAYEDLLLGEIGDRPPSHLRRLVQDFQVPRAEPAPTRSGTKACANRPIMVRFQRGTSARWRRSMCAVAAR